MNKYDAHKESIKGKTLTANELADAMDTKGFRYREVKAAVKMLRQLGLAESIIKQQQLEIEALREERDTANKAYMWMDETYKGNLAEIDALKKDLAKYDELAIDDLKGRGVVWCACGDAITPDSGALCGNCVSARPSQTLLTMTFEEMYPIAEKHLGHAIGLYNWKIFGDAVLRKAQEK